MKPKENYTIKELAKAFEVSESTIVRKIVQIATKFVQTKKSSTIPVDIANLIQKENGYKSLNSKICPNSDQNRPNSDQNFPTDDSFEHVEYFTSEEYSEFHKRLSEYPLLKNQIEDLKEQITYHKEQHDKLQEKLSIALDSLANSNKLALNSLIQRGLIEVKEKGLDKT